MYEKKWLLELFKAIDSKNVDSFISILDPDCTFTFGNIAAVKGSNNISDFVAEFFKSIAGLKHTITEFWSIPDGIICHGMVEYTRHDQSTLSVPFSNIFKLSDNKAVTYQIFADTSSLYAS